MDEEDTSVRDGRPTVIGLISIEGQLLCFDLSARQAVAPAPSSASGSPVPFEVSEVFEVTWRVLMTLVSMLVLLLLLLPPQ
jgi:hypothetical protein